MTTRNREARKAKLFMTGEVTRQRPYRSADRRSGCFLEYRAVLVGTAGTRICADVDFASNCDASSHSGMQVLHGTAVPPTVSAVPPTVSDDCGSPSGGYP